MLKFGVQGIKNGFILKMDDLIINENGNIVYKNIETEYTCENIFNILSNGDVNLLEILNKEIIVDFRDEVLNNLLSEN